MSQDNMQETPVPALDYAKISLASLVGGQLLDKRTLGLPASRLAEAVVKADGSLADRIVASKSYTIIVETDTLESQQAASGAYFGGGYGRDFSRPPLFAQAHMGLAGPAMKIAIFSDNLSEGLLITVNVPAAIHGNQFGAAGAINNLLNLMLADDNKGLGFGH